MRPVVPETPRLTPAEIRALPDGAKVLVRWCGGNGPWFYTLRHQSYNGAPPFGVQVYTPRDGAPDLWAGTLLEWDHEQRWQERLLEEVWLPDPTVDYA